MKPSSEDQLFAALRRKVQERLPDLGLTPERENDVVDELAQLLLDAALEEPERADLLASAPDLAERCRRWTDRQIPDFEELARSVSAPRREGTSARPSLGALGAPAAATGSGSGPLEPIGALLRDFRFAARMLAKRPVFTVVAVLTLGLGVGVNASVFSIVDALLLRPVPAVDSHELVNFYTLGRGEARHSTSAASDIEYFRQRSRTLEDLQAYTLTLLAFDPGTSRMAIGAQVTPGWFPMLGVSPALGRLLQPGDEDAEVLVLGHETWQREFGGDPTIVGSTIRIQGRPLTVVGVVPSGFRGFFQGFSPEVWLPIRTAQRLNTGSMQSAGRRTEGLGSMEDPAFRWVWGMGRLAEGATLRQVEAEFETLAAAASAAFPASHQDRRFLFKASSEVRLVPEVDGPLRLAGLLSLAVACLLLMIACANLANMLLARAIGRRHEMATRLSLGASKLQILRQLLAESLVLASAGGALGLALAGLVGRRLAQPDLPFPVPIDPGVALDQRVGLFVAAVTLITSMAFGLWPALASLKVDLSSTLREEGRGGGAGRRGGTRSALVVGQVALSVILLSSAGLMLRSLWAQRTADPGFSTDQVAVATLAPSFQGLEEGRSKEFFARLRERLSGLPGVTATAEISHLPLGFQTNTMALIPYSGRSAPLDEWPRSDQAAASSGYFELMEIPLLAGRTFRQSDDRDAAPVAVLNETAARALWPELGPSEWPVGRQLAVDDFTGDRALTVVGVVANGKYRSLTEQPRSFLWRPMQQQPSEMRRVLVAHRGAPEPVLSAIRRTSRALDERVGPVELRTLEEAMDSALFMTRTGSSLLVGVASLGLLLASLGLYGVLAQAVGERRHELGVRMALGARRAAVVRMILGDGLRLVAFGAALGLAGGVAAGRALSSFLYGVEPSDPLTFLSVLASLALVALAACGIPAARASRVDPSKALRWD
ncbi:MAG: ABC transporter permease [Acidobacteriota bacterium]